MRGVYPGSFNPLTVAHVAIAEAAVTACGLQGLDLAVSRTPLGKGAVERPRLEHRLAVLRLAAATRPWLGVVLTDARLLADIARGYDVLVLGADKWEQLHDVAFYGGSAAARDAALARLPPLAVAPRPPFGLPDPTDGVIVIDVGLATVSSTGVRAGRRDWMAPEAATFDGTTGAWSDPARYDAWCAAQGR